MIVIKVELWPLGDESRKQDLGVAVIINERTDATQHADYNVKLLKSPRYSVKNAGAVWREGEVKGYPRTSTQVGPWELLYMALKSALGTRVETVERLCKRGRDIRSGEVRIVGQHSESEGGE